MNSKLHTVCDGEGRPIILLLTEGQMSDYKGAALMVDSFPKAKELLGDKGYDADWFRQALIGRGITPCIPPKSNRKTQIDFDRTLYRSRHKIENMFGKLKDWRRIHTADCRRLNWTPLKTPGFAGSDLIHFRRSEGGIGCADSLAFGICRTVWSC